MNPALQTARDLVDLRLAAEAEVRAVQALSPQPLTAFERECIRTAFKAGADFGSRKQKERSNGL